MELDDLKEVWAKSTNQSPINNNIMEMIYRDSKGPLAVMKKNTKYTLYLFPIAAIFLGGTFVVQGVSTTNFAFGLVFLALFSEYIIAILNYFTINKIQRTGGNIAKNLADKITIMKLRNSWSLILYMGFFLLMPLAIEYNIHQPNGSYHGLLRFNLAIRLAWYAVVFIPLFVIRRHTQREQYGQYLEKLNTLMQQLY